MKRVLITETMHPRGFEIFADRDDIEVINLEGDIRPETLVAHMPGVHAIAARSAELTADILSHANELEVISRHGVGCDLIDVEYASGRGIPVAIASGANSLSVAEHTMALMMALARELPAQDIMAKSGNWHKRNEVRVRDLQGATILIVGFGRIGRLVAPMCKAFGMDVVVADIKLDRQLADQMGVRAVDDFHTELANTDFLSLHVPLYKETRHLISTDEFNAIKRGAIILNCARGGIVDDEALITALDSGQIDFAGIDVLSIEPPDPNHPIFKRDDVLITPHNGAASVSASIAMSRMTAENILDCFDGKLRDDCTFNLELLNAS